MQKTKAVFPWRHKKREISIHLRAYFDSLNTISFNLYMLEKGRSFASSEGFVWIDLLQLKQENQVVRKKKIKENEMKTEIAFGSLK